MIIRAVQRRRKAFLILLATTLLIGFAGGALGSGSGEEAAGTKGWVKTDTYRVMNFLVLAVGLFFILRKPASQALNARIKGIKEEFDELEAKKLQAEQDLARYNQKIALLDEEAEQIVAGYIKQGEEAKTRILKEAESAAEKLEEQARRNIEHEFEQAKNRLREDVLEKALARAEAIVKDTITKDDQEKLVDEYLEKVVVQ